MLCSFLKLRVFDTEIVRRTLLICIYCDTYCKKNRRKLKVFLTKTVSFGKKFEEAPAKAYNTL